MKKRVFNKLPLYDATFDEEGLGIHAIALVKRPANQRIFLALSEKPARFTVADSKKKWVTGLIIGVDQPIYRCDEDGYEYYVKFNKDTVEKIMVDFMREEHGNDVNKHHNEELIDGVFLIENYLKDEGRGISPIGYEDMADGSWFVTYAIEDEDVWGDIEKGIFAGFSIHGIYSLKESIDNDDLDGIIDDINNINNILDSNNK